MAQHHQHQQQPEQESEAMARNFRSLMLTYVAFATLGIACSYLFYGSHRDTSDMISQHLHIFSTRAEHHSLKDIKTALQETDCEYVQVEARLPDSLKGFMSSKLRYQFEPVVKNETVLQHCHVAKVGSLKSSPQAISLSLGPQLNSNLP